MDENNLVLISWWEISKPVEAKPTYEMQTHSQCLTAVRTPPFRKDKCAEQCSLAFAVPSSAVCARPPFLLPAGGLLHAAVAEQGRLERLSLRVQEHHAGHGGPAGLGLGPKHAFSVSVQPRSL